MRCPHCGCPDNHVVDTRSTGQGQAVRRRRECKECRGRFTTYEYVQERASAGSQGPRRHRGLRTRQTRAQHPGRLRQAPGLVFHHRRHRREHRVHSDRGRRRRGADFAHRRDGDGSPQTAGPGCICPLRVRVQELPGYPRVPRDDRGPEPPAGTQPSGPGPGRASDLTRERNVGGSLLLAPFLYRRVTIIPRSSVGS